MSQDVSVFVFDVGADYVPVALATTASAGGGAGPDPHQVALSAFRLRVEVRAVSEGKRASAPSPRFELAAFVLDPEAGGEARRFPLSDAVSGTRVGRCLDAKGDPHDA